MMLKLMKKPLIIAATAFALTIGFLVWWFSDSQVIKRQTGALADAFTMRADDSNATRVSKNQALIELLDSKFVCSIDLESYDSELRKDELLSGHLYLVRVCQASQVQMANLEITSLTDTSATVVGDFSISIREKDGGSHAERSPATLLWTKTEKGTWKLEEVTVEPR